MVSVVSDQEVCGRPLARVSPEPYANAATPFVAAALLDSQAITGPAVIFGVFGSASSSFCSRTHCAAGLVGAAMVLHVGPWAEEPLPIFWAVPTFNLTDQQGRPFGSADLNGRAALFSFVYTNCPDVCPLLTSNMAQIQNRLRTKGASNN